MPIDLAASDIIVGTAGWSIPKAVVADFPAKGTTLTRYAAKFPGVEINSTFYRSHRPSTYARWRDSVPTGFLFAVKVPKVISHEKRLIGVDRELVAFLEETAELGQHRGPLLIQLPPSLAFDRVTATAFLRLLRRRFDGPVSIEPRHLSWFTPEVSALLVDFEIALVGADPPRADQGNLPGGFRGLTYLRLHGSPRLYFSSYDTAQLLQVIDIVRESSGPGWCIFDNTASGAAASNALAFQKLLRR